MAIDESEGAAAEAGGKKKGGMLVTLIVALVAFGAGGGGAYFALSSQAPAVADAIDGGTAGPEGSGEARGARKAGSLPPGDAEDLVERTFELMPFVVNITDEGLTRYLKVKLELELRSADDSAQVEAYTARIRDAVIVLLSTKRLIDLNQFEGKLLLKDEMRDRINSLFGDSRVRSVLFTEFVVQ